MKAHFADQRLKTTAAASTTVLFASPSWVRSPLHEDGMPARL